MKKVEVKVLGIFLLCACALNMNAQVTIGSDQPAVKGALLQLKTQEVAGDNPNSKQGLMLPRVELDAVGSASGSIEQKLISSLKITLPPGTIIDAPQHTGLTVYNISDSPVTSGTPFAETKICPGVYVWDGSRWQRAMKDECQ